MMHVSAVPGAPVRRDDSELMEQLNGCADAPGGDMVVFAVMNEDGKVYRTIACASAKEAERVRLTFQELGFEEKNLTGTEYEDVANVVFWKEETGRKAPAWPWDRR